MELDNLCHHLFLEGDNYFCEKKNLDDLFYSQFYKYLQLIVTEQFNVFMTGQVYDFYVSYWSCFETCINNICRSYEDEICKQLNDSQFYEMKKYIKSLLEDENISEKHKRIDEIFNTAREKFDKKFGKYISFRDKYNYLFKVITSLQLFK